MLFTVVGRVRVWEHEEARQWSGRCQQAELIEQEIEGSINGDVQAIERSLTVRRQARIVGDGGEGSGGQRGVDAVDDLEEQDADAEAILGQAVRWGAGLLAAQALGPQFGQVVAK